MEKRTVLIFVDNDQDEWSYVRGFQKSNEVWMRRATDLEFKLHLETIDKPHWSL